jgi:hypothetical protein
MPGIRIVAATSAGGWSDWATVLQPTPGAFGERSASGTTPSPVGVAEMHPG